MRPDKYIKNFIDGEFSSPLLENYYPNVNPTTGEVYSHVPLSGEDDIQRAVESAERAYKEWSICGAERRFRILTRLADIIEQHAEDFARAEAIDTGRPYDQAKKFNIDLSHYNFRFYATSILHHGSDSHFVEERAISYPLRQPIGMVGCIASWNQPLFLFTQKIAPALAVGNTVVAKPSEVTPMSAYLLAKACQKGGLPPGVLNIVFGKDDDIVHRIASHPQIRAIAFTGSLSRGKKLQESIFPSFKKLALSVGGKNPNVIFADCDFENMIAKTLRSSFSNQGQLHFSCPRIFIERPIYKKFKEEFIKRTQFLKVGNPLNTTTDLGPIVSEKNLLGIERLIQEVKELGGDILLGGQRIVFEKDKKIKNGFFFQPTIIEGLASHFRINDEERYGPVVTIMPFDTEEEVIELVNQTEYGFCASIWTSNIERATLLASKIQVGMIWINDWANTDIRTNSSGVKNSSTGWQGGAEALKFFTEAKSITVKYK